MQTIARFQISMDLPVRMDEYKPACNVTHNLPRSIFMVRRVVELGDRPTRFIVLVQIPFAQLHIDEEEGRIRKLELTVTQDCNDI